MADQPSDNRPSPMTTEPRRYPFAPLAAAMGMTEAQAARTLNLSGSTARHYRRDGLSEHVAERLALKAGFHPYEIVEWDMVDHNLDDLLVECEAPDCTERFDPQAWSRKPRRFHSRACQLRTNQRRRYQQDAATRERKRFASRRYKAEIAELERRRSGQSTSARIEREAS